ncbi:unnamed protein product [Orchesella dallaii]|uniref:Glycoside hydrolase family 38 central domain-containing protein n=1 Tax=Orchesella dallaii TaxID=48710 RepID=A0ABP1QW12_9HEXA
MQDKREEQWAYMTPVDNHNLPRLASALNGQYRRTASLTQHNKVFTALGGDFRFEEPLEWDQQYSNYQKLMDYINHRPQQYHSTVKFGTLGQYFNSIEQNYDNLVQARRSIALFQHHDGITGTSPRLTMLDYSKKLTQAWNFLKQIQKLGIEAIWKHELKMDIPPLTEETSRKSFTNIGHRNSIKLYENTSVVKKVLLYNSLGWKTLRLVRLVVETSNVTVKGPEGEYILSQSQRIILENQRILAIFNNSTGMLQELENKLQKTHSNVTLSFGKYYPCVGSGAYLLRVCDSSEDWMLDEGKHKPQIILHNGPVMSQLSLISGRLKFSTWIINADDSEMSSSLFMKNEVSSSKSEYGEFFVRFQTDLTNIQPGESEKPSPVLFTDTNGFAVEKRITVPSLPYQANHYPMTHYAFIQDNSKKLRFTVLVDRTHGVSSMNSGQLEMIFDRVLQRDDGRGLGEGVHDSETAVSYYAVKLESTRAFNAVKEDYHSWEPTLAIQRTSKYLNHPPTIFTYDAMKGDRNGNFTVFTSDFPEDTFLISLRTLSGVSETIKSVPSSSALMTVHRMGHITSDSCSNGPSHSVRLNTALQLSHVLRKANLVGTLEDKDNLFQANNTRYLYLEKFYEMYSYFVDL